MRLELRPQAEAEFRAAALWYENEVPGLGATFIHAVTAALNVIAERPTAFPPIGRNARRFIMRRFPYVIIYRHSGDAIVVYACIHSHRDPKHWRKRL